MDSEGRPKGPNWFKIGCLGFAGFIAAAIALNVIHNIVDPEGYAEQQRVAKAKRASQDEWKAAVAGSSEDTATSDEIADRQKGLHCLSDWDGSNRSTVRQVKDRMRNPSSFEHVETEIYGNDNGEHGLWMTFRAENGFGGMNVERIYARVDHETCEARLLPGGPGSG